MNPGLLDGKSKIYSSRVPRNSRCKDMINFTVAREPLLAWFSIKKQLSRASLLNGFDCAVIKLIASVERQHYKICNLKLIEKFQEM